jgi:hypothetical protein
MQIVSSRRTTSLYSSAPRLIRSLAIVAALAGASAANGQSAPKPGFVDGIVTNAELVPLPNATVSILGSGVHVTTGENGRFRMSSVPTGRYIFVIHRVGYVALSTTVEVAGPDTVRPSFSLEPITNTLDTVVVTAQARLQRMTEFEDRRHRGLGKFITADDIDKRHAKVLGEILRPVLGVEIIDRGGRQYAYSSRGCPLSIYLDGMRVAEGNLSELPSPGEIAGIEIYTSATAVPIQYINTERACGSVMLWSR